MATKTILQLPSATSAAGVDVLPFVQGGVTKQITVDQLFIARTLITPNLGTPSAGVLSNCTGLPISTGVSGLGAGIATFLATPSSANLAAAVTNETGSGALVFATNPTLVTPTLGVATATSINRVTITAPVTSATLTIANGKTLAALNSISIAGVDGKILTINNSITFAGTDATTMTLPSTSATLARTDAAQTFTGDQTFANGIIGSIQSLSGPGAVNITQVTTAFTSTGTGDALTLVDGVVGEFKTVVYVAETAGADTGILTPATRIGYATITFTNVGDSVTLQYFTQGWAVIGVRGATVA
jgi:hypothetical protein